MNNWCLREDRPIYKGKVLILSDYLSVLDIIKVDFIKNNVDVVEYDGIMSKKQKEEVVAKFQNDDHFQIMLMVMSANEGTNITKASKIILVNPHWYPHMKAQAISRGWKLGKEQGVIVY